MIGKGAHPREDSVILLYGLLAQFAAAPADLRELIAPFKWPNYMKHGFAGFLIFATNLVWELEKTVNFAFRAVCN